MAMKLKALFPFCISLFLLACGQEDSTHQQQGEPPLIVAAEAGDLAAIETLLSRKTDVDIRNDCYWTPLMTAALNGHTEVAQRLLQAGAQTELADKGGYTALMLAASNNHTEIVELLLQRGADINRVESTGGFSALIWSAKRGHLETVELLLQQGADRGLRDHKGMTALDRARENSHQEIVQLLSGNTP
jgi:ankyrin repeat protein